MANRYLSPGVYIEEVRLPPGITGVDTSTTAFVGRAARGPVDLPVAVTSFPDFQRVFGGLWAKSDLGFSVQDFFEQGGRNAIVVRSHQPAPGDVATMSFGRGQQELVLEAASPGAWGRKLQATVIALRGNRRFDLTVTDNGTGVIEAHSGMSLAASSPSRVDRMLEASLLVRARLPLPVSLQSGVATVGATGGTDGARFSAAALIGPGMREAGRGLYALDRADLVNLIVIPPYSTRADVAKGVITKAISYAGERRALMILDSPRSWSTVDDAVAGAEDQPLTRDAALYYPRLRRPDPFRSGSRDFAPSGAIAGVLARVDLEQGVWRAPAGPAGRLHNFAPSLSISKNDIDRLGPLNVNCIRTVTGRGTVIWGARTRSTDPEWKYVNIRRTFLYIEESINRGLQWATFEPNDQNLWTRVRTQIENFLLTTWRQGAFTGRTADEAFFVRCGPDTMTQSDIDNGRLIVLIGIAPVKPAEFVLFRIGLWVNQED